MCVSVRPELIALQLAPPFVVIKTPALSLAVKMPPSLATIEVIRAFTGIPEFISVQVVPLSVDL